MKNWLAIPSNRKHLYWVCLAIIPLLVFYGVIAQEAAPLWIALVGAIVAPSVALNHISPADGRGSLNVPSDIDQNVALETED